MKTYDSKEVKDIINNINKQIFFEGRDAPYEKLNDREFEILSYCLFKRHKVEKDKEYDSINLMQGVGEKGRDSVLYKNSEARGIIQCKHTEKNSRMDRTQASKEIIKFALNCIKDKSLIPRNGEINYYFVHSFGFSEPAQKLLNNFYYEITLNNEKLKDLTNKVIMNYSTLSDLKYEDISNELLKILKRFNVKKYEKQDIDLLLLSQSDIISLFFQVKKVIEKNPSLPREYESIEPSKKDIIDVYNNNNFIIKLEEIKIKNEEKLEAIKNYLSTLKTIELLSDVEYFDEEVILAYESDLLRKYNNNYGICCEDIDEEVEEKEIRSLSRKFYRTIINQDPIKIIGLEDNRPFFQNGLYHDMANSHKIPTWMLKFIDEDDDDEQFNDFLQFDSTEK